MSYELGVWLGDDHVAVIREQRTGSITLEYTDDAAKRFPVGRPLLSVSMPLRPGHRYPPAVTGAWLEGLLPEGEARTQIEANFDVRRGDVFDLLAEIGRDCAGAVQFIPPGEGPATPPQPSDREELSFTDLADAVAALPERPLGAGDEVRLSLAGQQPKLLLIRDEDGGYRWPRGGAPSTHILKPGDDRFPRMVDNEAFCLAVARELGLTTIDVTTHNVGGKAVLVVERYDRARGADGTIRRIHQEDACQALAVQLGASGDGKYEANGGPSFADVARILDLHNGSLDETRRLVEVMTMTVALGNADAHGKNLSFLLPPRGRLRLAPLYDVVSTIQYAEVAGDLVPRQVSRQLAMAIDGHWSIDEITRDHLVAEGAGWHVATQVPATVDNILQRLPAAVESAAPASVPDQFVETVLRRIENLRNGHSAGA